MDVTGQHCLCRIASCYWFVAETPAQVPARHVTYNTSRCDICRFVAAKRPRGRNAPRCRSFDKAISAIAISSSNVAATASRNFSVTNARERTPVKIAITLSHCDWLWLSCFCNTDRTYTDWRETRLNSYNYSTAHLVAVTKAAHFSCS